MPATSVGDAVNGAHLAPGDTPSSVITGSADDLIALLWAPRFPSPELVDQAAALLPRVERARRAVLDEGPHPYIRIGPGVLEVRSQDYARADRTAERELTRRGVDVDLLADYLTENGDFPDDPPPTRAITEWSRKSRANMVRTLGLLDFTPMFEDRRRVPGMVTLTYPGDWLTVAPTGKDVKAHLKAFRKRYERAWSEKLRCVWKLEFQKRGAPHVHLLMVPPHGEADGMAFKQWLSRTWADVVAHPDLDEYQKHIGAGTALDFTEGMRATDPKRIGVYFSKHSLFKDKEYQHVVPDEWTEPGTTPGRFWGYWALDKATAVVEVTQDVAVIAGRTLRRWAAAQGTTREMSRPRTPGGVITSVYQEVVGLAGKLLMESQRPTRYRPSRSRVRRMASNRGFVMVNSGPEMASQLARYLNSVSQ